MSTVTNSEYENEIGLKRILIRDSLQKDLKKENVKIFNLLFIDHSSCHKFPRDCLKGLN